MPILSTLNRHFVVANMSQKMGVINQAISSLSMAATAMGSIEDLLKLMRGILVLAKQSDADQRQNLMPAMTGFGQQVNNLVADSSYQVLNLVETSTAELSISFSEKLPLNLRLVGLTQISVLLPGYSVSHFMNCLLKSPPFQA